MRRLAALLRRLTAPGPALPDDAQYIIDLIQKGQP